MATLVAFSVADGSSLKKKSANKKVVNEAIILHVTALAMCLVLDPICMILKSVCVNGFW